MLSLSTLNFFNFLLVVFSQRVEKSVRAPMIPHSGVFCLVAFFSKSHEVYRCLLEGSKFLGVPTSYTKCPGSPEDDRQFC